MNIKLKGIYIFKIYEVEKSDDKCFKLKKKKPPNLVKSALKNHKHPKNKFQKKTYHYTTKIDQRKKPFLQLKKNIPHNT
jgi:hypothetical protein